MTILDTILAQKVREVEELKGSTVLSEEQRVHASLVEKLKQPGITIISEIKRASPSKGDLNVEVDVPAQAAAYEKHGAGAISVLTDSQFFKGSFADLEEVRGVVDVPLLCKDFVIDEVQIQRANAAGADIILLIAAALEPQRLHQLYEYAKTLGLDVIVEVHNEEELEAVLPVQPDIIGVNNRNLKTFEVDLAVTERLAPRVLAAGSLLISESGIHSREDALRVQAAGASGILVGEAFMKADSLESMFAGLRV
ncbi:indole-3-glycerol phosphate synthase TrpC [Ectobacillus ponti]|uniref:Indole-3-glycerol phosphate synthase n=1 Tax=Ectobacillus ponti TaxID=2961894 RepID=A0AA41XAC1_9BACI|nr:indole-3-glycerol phosphate synthase TrpC [Ectobacillus ponti]MCP8968371.1 indole-3-glycerol phosphate synthase TrpC [Ectobacillus ponti]